MQNTFFEKVRKHTSATPSSIKKHKEKDSYFPKERKLQANFPTYMLLIQTLLFYSCSSNISY